MPNRTTPDYEVLAKLGLGKKTIKCYEMLFNNGGASVPQLAEQLKLPRTGLYWLLKQLEAKGFVSSLKTPPHPAYFFAEPLDKALQAYADYQRQLARELIKQQDEILIKRSGKQPA
jgi:sugar-specific transcriptional regulator TrmB